MTAKTTTTTRSNTPDGDAGAKDMAGATRQPLAAIAQTSATMLRAVGAWHQVNLQMLERAAVGQQQAAERLRQASSPAEVATVQSGLVMAGVGESMQYLQDLMNASLRIQGELMASANPQQGGAGVANPMTAPLVQAWQSMFTAPLNNGATSTTMQAH
ncbi:phasin family protein [Ramlibacter tataouinensis]|uniref:Phasin domain-containing protein n=1 Tax=Ramlibacter tataouinensis (strain ATCC BAA-407 / DSM 14655 / LMG 21543 / TTB310) TaxID=365046 RepID=F5XWX0_RAMTT|nr:phasin family protein [Ramlibacter tataouinensis]AEG91731.1 Hypothetical protein Rta_06530 [Ramlibacter tataouinensis TTB310]